MTDSILFAKAKAFALRVVRLYRYLPTSSLRATEQVPDAHLDVKDRVDEIVPLVDI